MYRITPVRLTHHSIFSHGALPATLMRYSYSSLTAVIHHQHQQIPAVYVFVDPEFHESVLPIVYRFVGKTSAKMYNKFKDTKS